ncbi:MAG TPA: hypothetical protein VI072_17000 [Polyangiaceae bacterium]
MPGTLSRPLLGRLVSALPRWSDVRGVLVLLHVVALCLAALPTARGTVSKEAMAQPSVQTELHLWGELLGVSPRALEEFALELAKRWDAIYAAVNRPADRYFAVTGTYQAWAVFIAPNRWPTRFQIQVHPTKSPPDEFHTVFEEQSEQFTWRRELFMQERGRVYFELQTWPRLAWLGPRVCQWAARELFRERPTIDRVRCRNYRAPSRSPEQVARREAVAGEWLHVDQVWR